MVTLFPDSRGTLIEISPVLVFNKEEYIAYGRYTLLDSYTFIWNWNDECRGGEKALA